MATDYKTNEEIGNYISINADVGDAVHVDCANGSFEGVVNETPDDVPVEEHQTSEVVCFVDGSQDIVGLYAQVQTMSEMRMEYDLYGVRMFEDGGDEDYGEVQSITVKSDE